MRVASTPWSQGPSLFHCGLAKGWLEFFSKGMEAKMIDTWYGWLCTFVEKQTIFSFPTFPMHCFTDQMAHFSIFTIKIYQNLVFPIRKKNVFCDIPCIFGKKSKTETREGNTSFMLGKFFKMNWKLIKIKNSATRLAALILQYAAFGSFCNSATEIKT